MHEISRGIMSQSQIEPTQVHLDESARSVLSKFLSEFSKLISSNASARRIIMLLEIACSIQTAVCRASHEDCKFPHAPSLSFILLQSLK